MELHKNISEKEFHKNVAYLSTSTSTNLYQAELKEIYETPQDCSRNAVNKNNEGTAQAKSGFKASIVTASIALILSILALLAATALAMYFGIQEANSLSLDSLQDISTLDQMVQALQTKLNNQDAIITTLLARSLGNLWSPAASCSDIPPGSL